ncbi:hypothetical protein ACNJFH_21475, partial [Mycobacterium tuberculosis]
RQWAVRAWRTLAHLGAEASFCPQALTISARAGAASFRIGQRRQIMRASDQIDEMAPLATRRPTIVTSIRNIADRSLIGRGPYAES